MTDLVELSAGDSILVLAPALGGGIARLDVGGRPVLRPWAGDENDPFSLASNVLVPFSNRISQDGFAWNGIQYDIAPNLSGEPFPIHGDGFQRSWTVARSTSNSARLTLDDGHIGPFRYSASQDFLLSPTSMHVELEVTNAAATPLPYGCGFHPWFPRSSNSKLTFSANGVWFEDEKHLPTEHHLLANVPDLSFASLRELPDILINNAFTDWAGNAVINQGPDHVSVSINSSRNLSTAIVYSPGRHADIFCFEPVSHPVDAFHIDGYPGLTNLSPGQSMRASMTLIWQH